MHPCPRFYGYVRRRGRMWNARGHAMPCHGPKGRAHGHRSQFYGNVTALEAVTSDLLLCLDPLRIVEFKAFPKCRLAPRCEPRPCTQRKVTACIKYLGHPGRISRAKITYNSLKQVCTRNVTNSFLEPIF